MGTGLIESDPELDRSVLTVIGGGTGSFHLLNGLRPYSRFHIQSIVSMVDSGGDSGQLRDEFGVLPPGDLRRCLIALSEESQILRDLFAFRFSEASLQGRSFGNLFLLALTKTLGTEQAAVAAISKILKIRGKVIPVTWDHAHLFAELIDGTIVEGEANIDMPKHDGSIAIRRVYLEPVARANPEAISAIETSDAVILAPGDLFTSIIPNLLVEGIAGVISKCKAPLIYILNLMTKYGETVGFSAADHIEAIVHYCGRTPDSIVFHDGPICTDLVSRYQDEQAYPVHVDSNRLHSLGIDYIWPADLLSQGGLIRHDPKKTAQAILQFFERWKQDHPSVHDGASTGLC